MTPTAPIEERPGMLRSLANATASTITDPSSWGDVAANFGKGALSGATLGLSEISPDLRPDPESWAGTFGGLAGMAPTAMTGAGLVAGAGRKLGTGFIAKALQKQLIADALVGGTIGVAEPRIKDAMTGKEENRSLAADALVGAAVPVAGHAALGLAKRLLGINPPINSSPDQPFPSAGKGGNPMGTAGLSPEMTKELESFVKTGIPSFPEGAPGGFPMGNAGLVQDTAPLAGQPMVHASGEEMTYLRPGVSQGTSIIKDSSGLTRPVPSSDLQPDTAGLGPAFGRVEGEAAPPTPPTGPPPETALGGTPGPSPAATTPVEAPPQDVAAPTIWSTVKDKTRWLMQKLNLPVRVLSKNIDTATPEGQLVNKALDATEGATDWIRNLEQAYQLKAPKGIKGSKTLWEQMDEPARYYWRDALAANQGNEAGALERLAQYPDPQMSQVMQEFTRNWNQADDNFVRIAVNYGLMQPNPDGSLPRIMNHLPFVRYRAVTPQQVKVEIGGEMQPVSSFFAEHPRAGSFMAKQRQHGEVPNWDMSKITPEDLVSIKMKSMGQMFANHEQLVLGGMGDAGQRMGPNGKPIYWIDDILNSIQDPEKRAYAVTYVNNLFGRYDKQPFIDPRVAANLRRMEFYHLISGNMLTPLVNLTQSLFTFSKVSTSNWGKAWYLLAKNAPEFVEPETGRLVPPQYFAEKYLGASGTFNKADEELLASGLLGKIAQGVSAPFRLSERMNQQHAAIAGFLEGKSRGMNDMDAIQFGKTLNRITQQFGGRGNTPEAFRGPMGSLLGQFKSFQIGMMGLIKDMFTDAGQGMQLIAEGKTAEGMALAKPLAKYMLAVGALGGVGHLAGDYPADAVRNFISREAEVEIPKWVNNGFLGLLGVNLANQIGLGALPATNNARDLLWFLPGPLVSHALDAASVISYVADSVPGLAVAPRTLRGQPGLEATAGPKRGVDLELSKLQLPPQPMTPDNVASKFFRAIPYFGPQIDKVHKWAKAAANDNAEIEAMDILQSVGWEIPSFRQVPSTGTYIRRSPEQGPLEQAMGAPDWLSNAKQLVFQPQSRYEDITKRQEEIESGQQYTSALRTYHSLIAAGKPEEAMRFAEQYGQQHRGMSLVPTAAALKAAYARQAFPATERLEQGSVWPLAVHRALQER